MVPVMQELPLMCLMLLLLGRDPGVSAQLGFSLHQPQTKVSVAAGETLTLRCTTSGMTGPGPVKWLKGWDRGNKTIYDQTTKDPSSPVMRAMNNSQTDFTIHIRNFKPEDTGTYYCVKFLKSDTGGDEVFQRGSGTEVFVQERALVPVMGAVAVVLCFLLLLLLGLFVALCVYRRKRQGRLGSPCPARTVAMGSFSPVPLQCCPGNTPSEVLEAESSQPPSQQSSKEENDIHYADLQPLPPAPRRGRSPGTAPTEYASLRVAAK